MRRADQQPRDIGKRLDSSLLAGRDEGAEDCRALLASLVASVGASRERPVELPRTSFGVSTLRLVACAENVNASVTKVRS
jgi:hypothetical protein